MKVVNLTPHDVHLHQNGEIVTIPASGITVRVGTTIEREGSFKTDFGALPISVTVFDDEILFLRGSERISAAEAGVTSDCAVIVSRLAGSALVQKFPNVNVLIPNEIIRDENGRIVGCESFDLL